MNKTTMMSLLLAMLAAQQLLLVAVQAEIKCSDVVTELSPCLGYLQGKETSPSAACCDGVTTLYDAADTKEERQQTCVCLKAAYLEFNVLVFAAQALPRACGLALPYPITPDVDCAKIN